MAVQIPIDVEAVLGELSMQVAQLSRDNAILKVQNSQLQQRAEQLEAQVPKDVEERNDGTIDTGPNPMSRRSAVQ